MRDADSEVLGQALRWLEQGSSVYLVTVLRTWGSSPRPPGSLMALHENGTPVGSVSGGCIEDDLIVRSQSGPLADQYPATITYGISADEAHRFGLPCGGRLELLLERLESAAMLRPVQDALASRTLIERRVCLDTGEVSLHVPHGHEEFELQARTVIRRFGPSWRLILIGAGQLSRFVAEMALALGYEVWVCDPREEYAQNWLLDDVRYHREMPDDVVRMAGTGKRCAVLALTHDPKLDDMALMEALQTEAFYVGALGSRENSRKRRQRLLELGLPAAAVERLQAPVGLAIGSRTPAEIAVSIMAALIAVRRQSATRLQPVMSVSR